MKKPVLYLLAFFVLAAALLAADATGSWSGNVTIGGETRSAYAVLKQSGANLTGTAGPGEGEQWPIQNGKIEGNKVSFAVSDPNGAVYKVSVTLDGNKAAGEVTVDGGPEAMSGKIELSRVK